MVKLEFNNMNELKEFMEYFSSNDTAKEEATIDYMVKNVSKAQDKDIQNLQKLTEKHNVQIELLRGVCEKQNNLIMDLQNKFEDKTVKKTVKKVDEPKQDTVRKYTKTQVQKIPQIKKMNKDGRFKLKNKRQNNGFASYTIKDVLILKSRINNTKDYPTWSKLCEDLEISEFTAQFLCYAIEIGIFDKYIHQWEEMKAKEFESKVKPVQVVNNPQKRRENGMM